MSDHEKDRRLDFKVRLSPYLNSLISAIAEETGRTKTGALQELLLRIETYAKHGKVTEAFGLEWIEQIALLNAKGHGARHLDPVHVGGGEQIDFDVTLLEKSTKSKTGFAGVNATTGNTFRALVPDVEGGTGSKYLASRPTAVLAAIDRYRHYEKWALPYGNIGFHMEHWRKMRPNMTDEERLVMIREDADTMGIKNPVKAAEVDRVLARHREIHGTKMKIEIEDAPRSLKSVPSIVVCCVCDQEIEDGEPFGPRGKDDYAHSSCA